MLVFACGLIAALVALSPELEQHFQVNQQEPLVNKESSTHKALSNKIQPVNSVGKELTSTPQALKINYKAKKVTCWWGKSTEIPKRVS